MLGLPWRRPPRGPLVLIVVVALALTLVAADWLVGRQMSSRVADAIECRLGVTDADVEIGGWPRALPLLTHRVPEVRVRAEGVQLGEVPAEVELTLSDVRRDASRLSATSATAVVDVPLEQLTERLADQGRQIEVTGDGDHVVATVGPELFPVSVLLRPELEGDRLLLHPDGIVVGGRQLDGAVADRLTDRLLERVGTGPVGQALTEGLPLPVPDSAEVTEVSVHGDDVRLALRLDAGDPGALLDRPARC